MRRCVRRCVHDVHEITTSDRRIQYQRGKPSKLVDLAHYVLSLVAGLCCPNRACLSQGFDFTKATTAADADAAGAVDALLSAKLKVSSELETWGTLFSVDRHSAFFVSVAAASEVSPV